MKSVPLLIGLLTACASLILAQNYRSSWGRGEASVPEDAPIRTAREVESHSTETPTWTNAPGLEKDVFTFVRVRYHRDPYVPRRGNGPG